ncbi:MAG TPA: di-heme oxidoredictase family protein [Chloroflexota bacterium]|nr:di-heme oxidoredictase family protein [Chloroflexota bacterium]
MSHRRSWQPFLLCGLLLAVFSLTFFTSPPGGATAAHLSAPEPADEALLTRGAQLFAHEYSPEEGLGPLFNGRSCLACHNAPVPGGMGTDGLGVVIRVGRVQDGTFDPLEGRGGPVARAHSVTELGASCQVRPGPPAEATLTSVRNAPGLFGLGLIDAIADETILAGAVPRGDGVHGRAQLVVDAQGRQRVGRFGWKADAASLEGFVAEAFRNELGMTSPQVPVDLPALGASGTGCADTTRTPEVDGATVTAVTAFIDSLVVPPSTTPAPRELLERGELAFNRAGCAACHVPSLPAAGRQVPLYSDLLLHDMGPALDDGVVQGQAGGRDWRTSPLWGLGSRTRFLHDGRARTVRAAILAHGGEAEPAARRFRQLPPTEVEALLAFLASL